MREYTIENFDDRGLKLSAGQFYIFKSGNVKLFLGLNDYRRWVFYDTGVMLQLWSTGYPDYMYIIVGFDVYGDLLAQCAEKSVLAFDEHNCKVYKSKPQIVNVMPLVHPLKDVKQFLLKQKLLKGVDFGLLNDKVTYLKTKDLKEGHTYIADDKFEYIYFGRTSQGYYVYSIAPVTREQDLLRYNRNPSLKSYVKPKRLLYEVQDRKVFAPNLCDIAVSLVE